MERTIDVFYRECIAKDILPGNISILADYIGLHNAGNDEHVQIIFGLYVGLIMYLEVPLDEIHEACLNNGLDALFHEKYKNRSSGYYKLFCSKNIKIGPTCLMNLEN